MISTDLNLNFELYTVIDEYTDKMINSMLNFNIKKYSGIESEIESGKETGIEYIPKITITNIKKKIKHLIKMT